MTSRQQEILEIATKIMTTVIGAPGNDLQTILTNVQTKKLMVSSVVGIAEALIREVEVTCR